MKKLLLIFCLAGLSISSTTYSPITSFQDVFICDSKGGEKYHFKKDGRGLSACKAPIKKLTLTDAKKLGRDICGWED